MSIEDVTRELYALAPEDFTAARNAAAKEAKGAGDAELAARLQKLRKPTAGAWLVNQWVRAHSDEVHQLLELGARLRAAQGTLGADELRALDQQRRQLTRAMAGQARDLGREAGRRVTEATTAEVEETLRSAMVDEVAGAALATGLLTDTFSSTGLDPVDLSRVVALAPGSTPAPTAPDGETGTDARTDQAEAAEAAEAARRQRLDDAERGVAEADSALEAARQVLDRAEHEAADAQHHREQLEAQREEARRRLRELDDQVTQAAEAEEAAIRGQRAARRDEAGAARAADRRREQLAALRR